MQISLTTKSKDRRIKSPKSETLTNFRTGFTMIELLAVVTIIGVIAAATGGLYIGTFKNMQLKKSAKEFYLAAKYARLGAIEKQTEFRLVIDETENSFFVTYKRQNPQTEESEDIVVSNPYTKPVKLPEGVKIEEIKIVPSNNILEQNEKLNLDRSENRDKQKFENIVVFTPYGTADCAVVKFGNEKTSYTISISPATGKVKIGRDETETPVDIIDLDQVQV